MFASAAIATALLTGVAFAETPADTTAAPAKAAPAMPDASAKTLATLPPNGVTVTDYYKQDVYDPANNKIGSVEDVLIDRNGQVTAVIIAVGGFLGIGQKDVAAPFHAVKVTEKDNKMYLVMNATKEELKAAPGFKYDRTSTRWVPDTATRG